MPVTLFSSYNVFHESVLAAIMYFMTVYYQLSCISWKCISNYRVFHVSVCIKQVILC